MKELIRRIVLIATLSLAFGTARFVDFGEYLQVTQIKDSQLRNDVRREWSMDREDKESLLSLPFRELLEKRAETPFQIVTGTEWETFFEKAAAGFEDGLLPREWRKNSEFSGRSLYSLWFRPRKAPWNTLDRDAFPKDHDGLILMLNEEDTFILQVRRRILDSEDYVPFSGFSTAKPPVNMFYPLRKLGIGIAIAGLFFYLFLPWPKPIPDSAYLKRWNVMFMDFAAWLLFFPFFMLGWFLAGPIPIGPNGGWIAAGMPWLLCLGGLYLFKQGAYYSLFAIKVEEDGLFIRTFQGNIKLPYKDIEKVQGAVLKSPRWLTILLAMGALFGRGSQRYLASGQALMLAGARYAGLAFTLKKGGTIYLWGSGQSGVSTFKHIKKFQEGLEKAGVTLDKKAVEKRGFGTEPRFDKAVDIRTNWMMKSPTLFLCLAPFLVTAAIYLLSFLLNQ